MPYLTLLRRPHVTRLLSSSLIGRLPTAMAALAIALVLREAGMDYRLVGLATGAYAVAGAVGGPLLGRVVDRVGQSGVLVVAAVVSAVGFALVALAPGVAFWAVAGAVLAGAATPPLEPCLRALWPELVDEGELDAAYAMDAGAQEIVFVAGPLLVGGMAAFGAGRPALWVAAVLGLVGSLAMASASPSRRWRAGARSADWLGPLRSRALVVLLVALAGSGWALGSFNVFAVAYAEARPLPGGAGLLLALSALGALIGAVSFGVIRWKASAAMKAWVLAAGMAATYWLVVLVPGAVGMCLIALATGVFFAPLLSVSFGLVGQLAPAGTTTEAFAWLVTLIGTGIAGGSAVGGALLDGGASGPGGALLESGALAREAAVGAVGVTVCAILLLAARRVITKEARVTVR
ncbi:MFS transporter [Nonomuraea soli]